MARKNGRREENSARGQAAETAAQDPEVTGGTTQQQNGTRKPPAHEVRIGRIRAVVWENHHQETGRWFSVNLVRTYKQGDQWKQATSLGRDDLLVGAECLRLAFLWIAAQHGSNAQQPADQPPAGNSEDIPI